MVAICKQYAREMNGKFGYLATWLPSVPLQLGDVGVVKDHVFEPLTSLRNLGIAFAAEPSQQAADLEYTSSDAVSIEFKSAGEVPSPAAGIAEASASIRIKRAEAVVFQATECRASRMADLVSLGDEILRRFDRGGWDVEHVVVTDLITAKSATVLISNSKDAKMDLTLAAQAAPTIAKLADASANVSRASGIGTRIVAAEGLTPLFKVAGIRRRILRGDTFVKRADESQFVELDYKDFV